MAMTEQELAQRTAEKKAQVEAEKTTTGTSAKRVMVDMETTTDHCASCEEEYIRTKVPSGKWVPERCPTCHPPEGAPRPVAESGYRGDILEDLYAAGVNVWKYQDAVLELFDSEHDPQALAAAEAWLDAWESRPRRRFAPRDWMFFYGAGSERRGRNVQLGKLGNGKTFLAVALARALIERQLLDPRRFIFRTAETILIESEATFKAQSDESEKKLLSFYERPELLIIDDLGVRHDPTPHAVRLFDELTKRREAKATIWTSNLSIQVLVESGETMKRIADRIAGECGDGARYVVKFEGPSRRRQRSLRVS